MSIASAFGKWGREDQEFKVILSYIARFWPETWDHVSKNKPKQQQPPPKQKFNPKYKIPKLNSKVWPQSPIMARLLSMSTVCLTHACSHPKLWEFSIIPYYRRPSCCMDLSPTKITKVTTLNCTVQPPACILLPWNLMIYGSLLDSCLSSLMCLYFFLCFFKYPFTSIEVSSMLN